MKYKIMKATGHENNIQNTLMSQIDMNAAMSMM